MTKLSVGTPTSSRSSRKANTLQPHTSTKARFTPVRRTMTTHALTTSWHSKIQRIGRYSQKSSPLSDVPTSIKVTMKTLSFHTPPSLKNTRRAIISLKPSSVSLIVTSGCRIGVKRLWHTNVSSTNMQKPPISFPIALIRLVRHTTNSAQSRTKLGKLKPVWRRLNSRCSGIRKPSIISRRILSHPTRSTAPSGRSTISVVKKS